jgi:hypothetical protein
MCKLSRIYTVHTTSLIIGELNTIQDFYEEQTPNDVFTMVNSPSGNCNARTERYRSHVISA